MSSHWLRQTSPSSAADLMDRLWSDGLVALAVLLGALTQVSLSNPVREDNWGTFDYYF